MPGIWLHHKLPASVCGLCGRDQVASPGPADAQRSLPIRARSRVPETAADVAGQDVAVLARVTDKQRRQISMR